MKSKPTNLLKETIKCIEGSGKSIDDVQWVGDDYIHFTWDEFVELSEKFNFSSGFGGNEVVGELMVVGSDWWMTRGEYDGSEWWDMNWYPTKPDTHFKPKHLKERWSGNMNHKSAIINSNFDSEEELKQYIRDNKISDIIDK